MVATREDNKNNNKIASCLYNADLVLSYSQQLDAKDTEWGREEVHAMKSKFNERGGWTEYFEGMHMVETYLDPDIDVYECHPTMGVVD